MSIAKEDIGKLYDEMLYRELSNISIHLEKIIGRQIIVTDGTGYIQYPYFSNSIKHVDDSFINLPLFTKKDYLYSEAEKCLYYHTTCKHTSVYIIVMDLSADRVLQTLTTIKTFKSYFSQINQTNNDRVIFFEWQMYEYLFGQSKASLDDILKLDNYRLPSDCYYVDVMAVRDVKSKEQWTAILSYSREYLKQVATDAIMISGPQLGIAAYIFPDRPKAAAIEPYKTALEKKFQITTSFGRSQTHPLNNLRKGCDEARIALHYPMVMETKAEIQYFSDLEYFTFLFSQELDIVKNFCWNMLEPLLDYDKKDCSLILTLAALVKYNYNLKDTAKSLFIHINTLYYRINKIEQLLCINMSLINARLNLFTALKAWDLLHISGLWDWSLGLPMERFYWGRNTMVGLRKSDV